MVIVDYLEKKFGWINIPNLTNYLVAAQAFITLLIFTNPNNTNLFFLQGEKVLQGQIWRLITFPFTPLTMNPIFIFFALYLFYLIGTYLEKAWGGFKYLVYILFLFFEIIALSFIFPQLVFNSGVIYTSLFLAFSYVFPELKLSIFFVIPVKVKWLAVPIWISIIALIAFGSISTKIVTIVSISNFLLFFGSEIINITRSKISQTSNVKLSVVKPKAYHICKVCGDNEVDNPKMEIRYCNECIPNTCYCGKHINNHKHIKTKNKK